jgi:hypothetical protein
VLRVNVGLAPLLPILASTPFAQDLLESGRSSVVLRNSGNIAPNADDARRFFGESIDISRSSDLRQCELPAPHACGSMWFRDAGVRAVAKWFGMPANE